MASEQAVHRSYSSSHVLVSDRSLEAYVVTIRVHRTSLYTDYYQYPVRLITNCICVFRFVPNVVLVSTNWYFCTQRVLLMEWKIAIMNDNCVSIRFEFIDETFVSFIVWYYKSHRELTVVISVCSDCWNRQQHFSLLCTFRIFQFISEEIECKNIQFRFSWFANFLVANSSPDTSLSRDLL